MVEEQFFPYRHVNMSDFDGGNQYFIVMEYCLPPSEPPGSGL